MNSLFNHAVKQSQSLKKDLDTFAASPDSTPLALHGQISATLTSFSRTLDDYANALSNELVKERKERAQTRLEKFRDELQAARDQFKELKLQREELIHNSNRHELLGRRHVATNHASGTTPENPYSAAVDSNGQAISREHGLSRESDVLGRAGHQLDDFLERGRAVLSDLGEQRDMLKTTRRKIYSVASTLGVSGETIRLVERRAFQDKWVFYGGILVMLVCFYFILKWF